MTGLVKEEILARLAELGLSIEDGCLVFHGLLAASDELLEAPEAFRWIDVEGGPQEMALKAGSLACSICQVPVIIQSGLNNAITIHRTDGTTQRVEGHALDAAASRHIFGRDGLVHHLLVQFRPPA